MLIISVFLSANVYAAPSPEPGGSPGVGGQPPAPKRDIPEPNKDQAQDNKASKGLFENATYENFEEQKEFEVFEESLLGSSSVKSEATENLDSGAITKIQSTFLGNLNIAFSTVAKYALNLLYLFAVLEVVIFGLIWALQRDVGWEKLFFKIIKIGLIFFIIQNYTWLLDTIMQSFAQLAGVVINNTAVAKYIFNPAKIWAYGYDSGINLLQLATTTNSFGLAMVQISLGMGILLVFGLLGIQMVLQIVGFYMVSLGALIFLPFGAFILGRGMFDKAVQAVFQAGIRLMVLIIIIGVAVVVWDGFQLMDLAQTTKFNINQPLGLFFTALLFLCLALYLPKVLSQVVGSFGGDFLDGGQAAPVVVRESGGATIVATGDTSDMRAATAIEGPGSSTVGGYAGGGDVGTAAAQPVSVNVASAGGSVEAKMAKGAMAQASYLSKSISETTVKKIKEAVLQAVKEK